VVAVEQEPENEADGRGDRDRRAGILAHVPAHVVPEIAVVFLDALGRRLDALADVLAHVVELLPCLRVGVAQRFLGPVDLLFHEIPSAVKWGFFRHEYLRFGPGSYTLGRVEDGDSLKTDRSPLRPSRDVRPAWTIRGVVSETVRGFRADRGPDLAGSLAFTTLLTAVPLLATFSLFLVTFFQQYDDEILAIL